MTSPSGAPELVELVGMGPDDDRLRTECVRVATALERAGRAVVGLLPVSEEIAVMPVALRLGEALALMGAGTIGVVDANARWPAFRAEQGRDQEVSIPAPSLGLTVLVPRGAARAGEALAAIDRTLERGRRDFVRLLVDLTGLARLGEEPAAIDRMDGIVLVARAGQTTEQELVQRWRDLPPERRLGVLLMGARR